MALIPALVDLKNSYVNTTTECVRNFLALDRNAKIEIVIKTCAIAAIAGITVYFVSTPIIVAVCAAKITLYLATRTQRREDNNMFEAFVRGAGRNERLARAAANMMGMQAAEADVAPVDAEEAVARREAIEENSEEEVIYAPIPQRQLPHVEEIVEEEAEAVVPEAKAPAAAAAIQFIVI